MEEAAPNTEVNVSGRARRQRGWWKRGVVQTKLNTVFYMTWRTCATPNDSYCSSAITGSASYSTSSSFSSLPPWTPSRLRSRKLAPRSRTSRQNSYARCFVKKMHDALIELALSQSVGGQIKTILVALYEIVKIIYNLWLMTVCPVILEEGTSSNRPELGGVVLALL